MGIKRNFYMAAFKSGSAGVCNGGSQFAGKVLHEQRFATLLDEDGVCSKEEFSFASCNSIRLLSESSGIPF